MATIENFATVRYVSNGTPLTRVSNVAEIGLASSVTFAKLALGNEYNADGTVTYILTVSNTASTPLTSLTVTDDLGTFTEGGLTLTPLSYVGPSLLLVDGQDVTAQLTVDSTNPALLIFTIPALAAGATANILYVVRANEFAPLDADSAIVNTATLVTDADCADGTASATVTVASAANVSVLKQMSPNPVVCGDTVTYTIRIYNDGNAPAEQVQLVDAFDPAPTNVTVSRNGVLLTGTAYTYVGGVLTVPPTGGPLDTVPAATFERDATTGEVIVTPGIVEYVITGVI
jgi:uncharacterized repeat protein (TIGR01451 family)